MYWVAYASYLVLSLIATCLSFNSFFTRFLSYRIKELYLRFKYILIIIDLSLK